MESNRTADRGSTLSQCQVASEELERLIREFNGGVGPSDIHLVATLHFDSLDALKAGMASPEGRAAGGSCKLRRRRSGALPF